MAVLHRFYDTQNVHIFGKRYKYGLVDYCHIYRTIEAFKHSDPYYTTYPDEKPSSDLFATMKKNMLRK